jgi:asparagine synthase (glutamine-hydrolysing)
VSGIFGIINLGNRAGQPVSKSDLQRMQEALKHRGRDGTDLWLECDAALGHLATNITPESVYEKLPYKSPDGRYVITADTRIDNREELFNRLSIPHLQRVAMPDSILILTAFRKWGRECPAYLLGEFTFAIWDKQKKTLLCARDHLGVRPFFYYHSPGHFVFATEIKGIRALDIVPCRFNETALALKMLPVDMDFEETFFKGIKRLKAANRLELEVPAERISTGIFWDPRQVKQLRYSKDSDYAEALRELMTQSVHHHLRTLPHIKAAVGLSGGLDSSSIACIAARKLRENGKRLIAVSSVLPENHTGIETDERYYIREVLEQEPNIDICYVTAEYTGPFDLAEMEAGIRELEAPVSPFHYMDRALCNAARESGADILLWGLGGDSISSRDGRYSLLQLLKTGKWGKILELIRQMQLVEGKPALKIILRYLLFPMMPDWSLKLYQWIKHGKNYNRMKVNTPVTPGFAGKYGFTLGTAGKQIRKSRSFTHEGFFKKHSAGRFLIEKESIRHAHLGLSAGYPCWDKRIIEFSLGVPPEQFLLGGWKRSLFRRAMEGILPTSIQWRRDKHVYVPDFHSRILVAKPDILRFLDTIGEEEQVHRYIDINRIENQLDHIRPVKGRPEWETGTQGIVMKGVIFIKFLQWINKETRD